MSFLPIVERELRVASRRKSTLLDPSLDDFGGPVGHFPVHSFRVVGGQFHPRHGPDTLHFLTYYTFGLSLLAGVFLAADCLSEKSGTEHWACCS